MPLGSFSSSPYLSILQRPTSPCLSKHTVLTTSKKKNIGMWTIICKAHLNGRKCIQTHWMALAEARRCLVPSLLVLCHLTGLGFWFLTALYALYFAKKLKQRHINKLADAWGRKHLFSLGFLPCLFQNYVLYKSLDVEGIGAFQLSFGYH